MREKEHKHWTNADLNRLEFMADKGFRTEKIAENLGRTEAAIYTKASEEKISLKPTDR